MGRGGGVICLPPSAQKTELMQCFGPTAVCLPVMFIRQHEIIATVYSGYLFFFLCFCFVPVFFPFYGKRGRKSALDDHEEPVIALQPTALLSSIIWHQAGHQTRDATCECANLKFLMSEWAPAKERKISLPVRARHPGLCGSPRSLALGKGIKPLWLTHIHLPPTITPIEPGSLGEPH